MNITSVRNWLMSPDCMIGKMSELSAVDLIIVSGLALLQQLENIKPNLKKQEYKNVYFKQKSIYF